jgi:malonyl-ACP O-methyltransferase BioC
VIGQRQKTVRAKPDHRAVARRFGAAAATYERRATIQWAVADSVADLAADHCPAGKVEGWILEIGCGTGLLTRRLSEQFPNASLVVTDVAAQMVEATRARIMGREQQHWVVADALRLPFTSVFRMIVSSSTLHWIHPLQAVVARAATLLHPGGYFFAGLMLDGTLRELHALRREVAPEKIPRRRLPDEAFVRRTIGKAGLQLLRAKALTLKEHYVGAHDFLRIIHQQGLTGGNVSHGDRLLTRSELQRLIAEYERRYADVQGGVYATYRVLFVAARKEARLMRGTA